MLKCQIQNKCQYIDLKGMRIPISPDGIPMVNLARPIQSFQGTDETLKNYFWKIQKTRNLDSHAVGLVVAWPYGLVIDFVRNPIHGSAVWFFVIIKANSVLPCDSLLLLQKGSDSNVTQLFLRSIKNVVQATTICNKVKKTTMAPQRPYWQRI